MKKKKYRESKASQVYAVRLTPERAQYLLAHGDELRDRVKELITLEIDSHKLSQLPAERKSA